MQRKQVRLGRGLRGEGGKNISYVFGGEVVLDLTFPLAHKATTKRGTEGDRVRVRKVESEPLEGSLTFDNVKGNIWIANIPTKEVD